MAPRILSFSIAMDAEYLPYVKSIETHARAFLPLNILAIGTVSMYILRRPQKFDEIALVWLFKCLWPF